MKLQSNLFAIFKFLKCKYINNKISKCNRTLFNPWFNIRYEKRFYQKKYIQVLGNGNQQKPYSHIEEILDYIFFKKKKNLKKN